MKPTNYSFIRNTSGIKKILICISLSVLVYIILWFFKIDMKNRIILTWDIFCLSLILFSWALFITTTDKDLCDVVELQDDGLKIIFTIVIIAVCFSLFGSLLLLENTEQSYYSRIFNTIVSLSQILISWILLHTNFTIRYAHLYHDHNKLKTGSMVGGIKFPGKEEPDYIDFAYFSFVIGMTFQVSDIQVTSKVIRKFVLLHSIISFMFNTIIVALTINSIASFK